MVSIWNIIFQIWQHPKNLSALHDLAVPENLTGMLHAHGIRIHGNWNITICWWWINISEILWIRLIFGSRHIISNMLSVRLSYLCIRIRDSKIWWTLANIFRMTKSQKHIFISNGIMYLLGFWYPFSDRKLWLAIITIYFPDCNTTTFLS